MVPHFFRGGCLLRCPGNRWKGLLWKPKLDQAAMWSRLKPGVLAKGVRNGFAFCVYGASLKRVLPSRLFLLSHKFVWLCRTGFGIPTCSGNQHSDFVHFRTFCSLQVENWSRIISNYLFVVGHWWVSKIRLLQVWCWRLQIEGYMGVCEYHIPPSTNT